MSLLLSLWADKTLASFDPVFSTAPYHPHSLLAAHRHRLLLAGCFYNKLNLSDKAALMMKEGRLLLARPAGLLYTVQVRYHSILWVGFGPQKGGAMRCNAV